jgi:hypothetical protein
LGLGPDITLSGGNDVVQTLVAKELGISDGRHD